jgi:hypothetical protein
MALMGIVVVSGNAEITWTSSVPGKVYRVEWSHDLQQGFSSDWTRFITVNSTGTSASITVPVFYRVTTY